MIECCRSRRNLDEANEVADVVDRFHQLSLQFPGVPADSQIATALAVRELVFVAIFSDVVHFSAVSACIYKTRTKKISGRAIQSSSSRSLGRIAQSAATIAAMQKIASNNSWLI